MNLITGYKIYSVEDEMRFPIDGRGAAKVTYYSTSEIERAKAEIKNNIDINLNYY